MRRLIVATIAAAGLFVATAQAANGVEHFTVPPNTVLHGWVANCEWELQAGEYILTAYTNLWYLGPQCTNGGFFSGPSGPVWANEGGRVVTSGCSVNFPAVCGNRAGNFSSSLGFYTWDGSTADVCGVWPGVMDVCQVIIVSRKY